jgi:hypothetical protein
MYHDQYPPIEYLTNEQKGILLDACFKYNLGKHFDITDPFVEMAFSFIKQTFIRDNEKYQKRVEQNRKNGLRGGRPKKEDIDNQPDNPQNNPNNPVGFTETEKSHRVISQPKKADSGSVPGNDNDPKKLQHKKHLNTTLPIIGTRDDVLPKYPETKWDNQEPKKPTGLNNNPNNPVGFTETKNTCIICGRVCINQICQECEAEGHGMQQS